MSNVVTRFNAPLRVTLGADGVPNYISAQVGDPVRWRPPAGMQLRVYCDGRELQFVVECDRVRGWAHTRPWEDTVWGPRMIDKRDDQGVPILWLYEGRISYRLVRAHVPGWLRTLAARA